MGCLGGLSNLSTVASNIALFGILVHSTYILLILMMMERGRGDGLDDAKTA